MCWTWPRHVRLKVSPRLLGTLALLLACRTVATASGDDQELPEEVLRPGLIGWYSAGGETIARLEDGIRFHARETMPDERLAPGPFRARWTGFLRALNRGEYRFRIRGEKGRAAFRVSGRLLMDGELRASDALESASFTLEFGDHPFELEYTAENIPARMRLFWSGPDFVWEPIPAHYLWHDPAGAPADDYERGRLLAHGLRCGRCHVLSAGDLAAPSLTALRGNMNPEWIVDLLSTGEGPTDPDRRMPYFALSKEDAECITASLLESGGSEPPQARSPSVPGATEQPPTARVRSSDGDRLFHTLGCLACHSMDGIGRSDWFSGGDLGRVADKRPADFFRRWLTNPGSANASHRMPTFDLGSDEVGHLAAFLAAQGSASSAGISRRPSVALQTPSDMVERGTRLVRQFRCGACHELPGKHEPIDRVPLPASLSPSTRGCLAGRSTSGTRPSYFMKPADLRALEDYLRRASRQSRGRVASRLGEPSRPPDPCLLLAANNCLGCHRRHPDEGLSPVIERVIARNPPLAGLAAAMVPPALDGIGDKFREDYLRHAIVGARPRLRPWLAVRMPRYRFDDAEAQCLTRAFIEADLNTEELPGPAGIPSAALVAAGRRLVTAEGFGCASCHAFGNALPENPPLHARGPDLALAGLRLRRSWFERWLHDPGRMVPRMEMPAVRVAVPGILDGRIETQREALWVVLNQPDVLLAEPYPVRALRRRDRGADDDRAAVLTDVVQMEKRTFIKPIVIGLPNRHNVLLDLQQHQLAGWWMGEAAHQYTSGKSWFWTPAGTLLLAAEHGAQDAILLSRGASRREVRRGQFLAELDAFEHVPQGLRVHYHLHFQDPDQTITLNVAQTFQAEKPEGARTGILRTWQIGGLPHDAELRWRVMPGKNWEAAGPGILTDARRRLWVELVNKDAPIDLERGDDAGAWMRMRGGPQGLLKASLRIVTDVRGDSVPEEEPRREGRQPHGLSAVPGFEVNVLPLDRRIMPTGFAWSGDGSLLFTSLKGEVFRAVDTDGDDLEDHLDVVADGLPAPYGIHAGRQYTDVICKYGLVRVWDRDGDHRADRVEVVASGWGHTDDYHDWAVGLPCDEQGRYYVALPCQQDERPLEAARLRGTLVRLTPDGRGRFAIEELCAGLRFPMGLAQDRRGNLFATDNQGNYNPFNELNHLLPKARYGFINKVDEGRQDLGPVMSPAIEIPHPWTRSVNGICFLYTPSGTEDSAFGPFEGHLVGCEYDNRGLVRMSLEEVEGAFQGAVYPFSIPQSAENSLEGPVVCAISPQGNIYVGNLRDSGWGAGANTGSIARLRPPNALLGLPQGIAEVRIRAGGFTLHFTRAVEAEWGENPAHFRIESFRRESTPAYGGPDLDRRRERIERITLLPDRKGVQIDLGELRGGHVYEIHVEPPPGSQEFFPAEAYYTVRRIPSVAGEAATSRAPW